MSHINDNRQPPTTAMQHPVPTPLTATEAADLTLALDLMKNAEDFMANSESVLAQLPNSHAQRVAVVRVTILRGKLIQIRAELVHGLEAVIWPHDPAATTPASQAPDD
jgi:hypothetical protein